MKNQQQQSRKQAAIVIQKWYRGHKSRSQTKRVWKKLYDRKKIIEELVVTEEKYIHDLSIIISDFQMYLFNSKIITPNEVYILFSNVDAIRKLNEHFFVLLYNNFKDYWNYKTVFQDVKKQVSFFKIYFEYLNNFTHSMGLMRQLKENNSKFKQFLMNIKKNPNNSNLDLEDYLIKPVQRLPKYVLLLKLLVKKTEADHPDYLNIKKLLEGFQDVNSSNNQKLNKLMNNFKLSELQREAKLPFHIAEPGTQFILEENVTILNSFNKVQDAIMYLLNNRVILTKKTKSEEKFLQTVNFRYGVSIMENQDQELYQNCFTLQSIDGDSITFLFQGQQQMKNIIQKIQEQIIFTERKTYEKYTALQNANRVSESFIKKICRYDLMPEVSIIGTQQRTDKMLKYTTYIIEVKIKNIRQKIFIRYSELLQLQCIINLQFPDIEIKQQLYKTTWFLNHKPRTIEQRKMNIQKFLTEVLSKPQIIQSGSLILSKLGLPQDLYELPQKLKTTQSFIKRSSIVYSKVGKSQRETKDRDGFSVNAKTRNTYRLSIFMDLEEEETNKTRKLSLNDNFKSTVKSSINKKKLNIEEILFANELNLGHYVRYSQNVQYINKNKIKVNIYIPWIQNSKGLLKKTIQIMENQRVSALVNKLAKQIGLKYYKDFRIFLQKQHFQRVLDDDEIIQKVETELISGKYNLFFKKMIYIDQQSEENQIKNDQLRLKIIASQIVYEVRKSKYKLNYSKFLTLSVLIGIIQHQSKMFCQESQGNDQAFQTQKTETDNTKQQGERNTFSSNRSTRKTQPNYKSLAFISRKLLQNLYASFFENDKVWNKDFQDTFKNLQTKLKKIARGNTFLFRATMYPNGEQQIWTNIVQLSYISIIDQIKTDPLFGSNGYVVQISEQFRQILIQNIQEKDEIDQKYNLDLQTKQNRNVWFMVKCDQIFLYTISLSRKLFSIKYDEIQSVVCYPSSIIIQLKDKLSFNFFGQSNRLSINFNNQSPQKPLIFNRQSNEFQSNVGMKHTKSQGSRSLKFKTTCSYFIKVLITYYKNYNDLSKKIKDDQQYTDSIIQMINQNSRYLNEEDKKEIQL